MGIKLHVPYLGPGNPNFGVVKKRAVLTTQLPMVAAASSCRIFHVRIKLPRLGFDTHWLKSERSRKMIDERPREVTPVVANAALRTRSDEDDILFTSSSSLCTQDVSAFQIK